MHWARLAAIDFFSLTSNALLPFRLLGLWAGRQAGREGLEGMLVCGAGPGCNNASSAVSRCRQSDLPGTPWRIRVTSAGTGRGATWGDVSHVGCTSQEHGSGEPWEKCCRLYFEHKKVEGMICIGIWDHMEKHLNFIAVKNNHYKVWGHVSSNSASV